MDSPTSQQLAAKDNPPVPADHHLLVLVADDDVLMRRSLDRLLALTGITAETVANGKEAISWLSAHQCNLVITDLEMPHVDGLAVLAWVKENRPHLPTILISGKLDAHIAALAQEHGAMGSLRKPFSPQKLAALVADALSSPNQGKL